MFPYPFTATAQRGHRFWRFNSPMSDEPGPELSPSQPPGDPSRAEAFAPPPNPNPPERAAAWVVPRWLGVTTIAALVLAVAASALAGIALATRLSGLQIIRTGPNTSLINKPSDIQDILTKVEPG